MEDVELMLPPPEALVVGDVLEERTRTLGPPIVLASVVTMADACAALLEKNQTAAIVFDSDRRCVLTENDVLRALTESDDEEAAGRVVTVEWLRNQEAEQGHRRVHSVPASTPLTEAAAQLIANVSSEDACHHLIVTSSTGDFEGLVSSLDLARAMASRCLLVDVQTLGLMPVRVADPEMLTLKMSPAVATEGYLGSPCLPPQAPLAIPSDDREEFVPMSPPLRPKEAPCEQREMLRLLNSHLAPSRDWEVHARKASLDEEEPRRLQLSRFASYRDSEIKARKATLRETMEKEKQTLAYLQRPITPKEEVRVEDVMKTLADVQTCEPSITLREAALALMLSRQNCVLVKDEASVQGVITPRDLLLAHTQRASAVQAGDWVREHSLVPRLCARGTLLVDAATHMAEQRVHHVVITDGGGDVVGVLSSLDLAYTIAPSMKRRVRTVTSDDVAARLGGLRARGASDSARGVPGAVDMEELALDGGV